ncbi:MAG TPA: Crp/Fnr family transcriptional regulator [Candidatus Angelobacter sp.]
MTDGIELNELYVGLAPAVVEELTTREDRETVPAGTKLISQGTMPEHLIFIEQGSVEVAVPAGDKALCLSIVGPGKVLGLRAIVANVQPEIDATAVEQCAIVRIPKGIFLEVLKQHPEMYFAISKVLSNDLNTAERVLRGLPRSPAKEKRLANV